MKVRVVRSNINCRLPKPSGKITADVCRAVELYNSMHGSRPLNGRTWHKASWELQGLLKIMSREELAEYYAWVPDILLHKRNITLEELLRKTNEKK